jgi:hypothetical protein
VYADRHKGRDFLVLGTGASINQYGQEVKQFARKHDLLLIGANNITPFAVPDYHLFANRARLQQYGNTVDSARSRALVSIYLTDEMIEQYCAGEHEFIMWRDTESPDTFDLDDQGVLTLKSLSGTLMLGVAYAMGAHRIYLAGMDGWADFLRKETTQFHFAGHDYEKYTTTEKRDERLAYWEDVQQRTLHAIARWARENGRVPFESLTPTNYGGFFNPDLLNHREEPV